MDKINTMRLLGKYKSISQILGLRKDEELLDELINMLDKYDGGIEKEKVIKKARWGETDFQQMILEKPVDLSKYELSDSIVANRGNMVPFWSSLIEADKSKFTIFELNTILYLVSPQYNKYQKKDKQKIIHFINQVVREKRQEDSYRGIEV